MLASTYWIEVNLTLFYFFSGKMEREDVAIFIPMALPPGLLGLDT